MRESIYDYLREHPELNYKDFSESAVAIAREAR